MPSSETDFAAFTEDKYRELLALAARRWRFVSYPEAHGEGRRCLWRHDIDVSPHRALRLAQIEVEAGVRATYFVLLHGYFYNALETEVAKVLLRIRDLGHELGLHFDPAFYAAIHSDAQVRESLEAERELLERMLGCKIRAFSFHDPDLGQWGRVDDDELAGMVNAYGNSIQTRYGYVSDSNGYWRYRDLREVLLSDADERLHVLTHPEWWTPEPLSPRDRIARSVAGRARRSLERYDSILAAIGRKNVR